MHFTFASAFLEHAHIFDQTSGLVQAGAFVKWVFDPDPAKISRFQSQFPGVKIARSFDEILEDPDVRLIASAAIPCERAVIGCRVMAAGKDYFTDKAPFTTLEQLAKTRNICATTGRKYLVYFSERMNGGCTSFAGELVRAGAIGQLVQVVGLGPHRLGPKMGRPPWFYERDKYGGILCDLAVHQVEQFLYFSGATNAEVTQALVGNFANPDTPQLEDFGEASLVGDNGVSHYLRVDWLTPSGLSTWGDGRTILLGTKGFIELRKNVDIARAKRGENIYLVDERGEHRLDPMKSGKTGFDGMIRDCLERAENFMLQEHIFKAAEISLKAQATARRI